jgi:hypothetical protein
MAEDPLLAGKILPSRLHILMQRLAGGNSGEETYPQEEARHDSEEGGNESEEREKTLLRNREKPSVESAAGEKPLLRNPKRDCTSTSTVRIDKYIKEVRTVPRARAREEGWQLPQRFLDLKEEQQAGAWVMLKQVDGGQRQAVLDEWDARCRAGKIRHPAGYLFGIVQKALRGEFKVWAGQNPSAAAPDPPGTENRADVDKPARPESVQEHLANIRAILRAAPYLPGPP